MVVKIRRTEPEMDMDELLQQLENVTPTKRGWSARCPAHSDEEKSLTVSKARDSEGCNIKKIVKTLGLEIRDLFPSSQGLGRNKGKEDRDNAPEHFNQTFPKKAAERIGQNVRSKDTRGRSANGRLGRSSEREKPVDIPKDGQRPKNPPEQIRSLAAESRILDRFARDFAASGVAGEDKAAKLIYLAVSSRFLDQPVSCVVGGPSSGGKSFLVKKVLRFFPQRAYYAWTAMSDKALAYDDEPMCYRFLVLYEAAGLKGDTMAYLVRSLLSEGRTKYMTVEKENGKFKTRKIERKGPTGLLSTTTAVMLESELETRYLSIPVNDSREQTRNVLMTTAKETNRKAKNLDPTAWIAFQKWLESAEHRVQIPFAEKLAETIDPRAIRMRRDFQKVLNLIKAHAILHQASRDRDDDGWIIATLEDYAVVRELVGNLLSEVAGAAVSDKVRETIDAVRHVLEAENDPAFLLNISEHGVTVADVARRLGLDNSTAWRRVKDAIGKGYLKNQENRPHRPARIVLGEALPTNVELLPPPETLR